MRVINFKIFNSRKKKWGINFIIKNFNLMFNKKYIIKNIIIRKLSLKQTIQ